MIYFHFFIFKNNFTKPSYKDFDFYNKSFQMPKIKTLRTKKAPKGFDLIEPVLE